MMRAPTAVSLAVPLAFLGAAASLAAAQFPFTRPPRQQQPEPAITIFESELALAEDLKWRNIGPANHSGRIVDIAVDPTDPTKFYVASATGGLWKTENKGLAFKCVFENEGAIAIGAIAIDPRNPDVIWLGSGEANNQRSSYAGDGIYRSDDGGKTWKNMGLRDSHHIGRIVIDPKNGKHVLVAVLGHLYTPNEERGLYRTVDGGKTWNRVLSVNPDVGVVDVAMQPGNNSVLLAATYERRRRAWHFEEGGEGSGVWRSEDGGATWQRLEKGLPRGKIGRIGIAFAESEPETAYLVVENANARVPSRRARIDPEEETQQQRRSRRSRTVGGEVYRSKDGGKTWKKASRGPVGGSPHYYYGQIRVDPSDTEKIYVLGVMLWVSKDGGKSFPRPRRLGVHVDHHALWIDPEDGDHLLLGNDGGLAESYDGSKTWVHYENLPLGQYYAIGVDLREPYCVYGGTQDNGSWGVPSQGPVRSGIRLRDCFKVAGGDGFYCEIDPEDQNIVYVESQFGRLVRVDLRSMQTKSIRPRPRKGEKPYRFNWNSPIQISPHNHTTIYFGGNKLFRSVNRGDKWEVLSPDLTTKNAEKIKGNVPHCTITTLAESEIRPGLIWVGTDDGKLWLTPDSGRTWKDLTEALPREAQNLWVSRVAPSRFEEGRAYVSITGYREDVFRPMLYVTEDYGLSFQSLSENLPEDQNINVVREDPRNEDLLLVGTENGVYASVDGGGEWARLGQNLPKVPVHDLVVHPRDREVAIATHGRGMYVLDIASLEQWTETNTKGGAFVVEPNVARRYPRGPDGGYTRAPRTFRGPNPSGAELCAYLAEGFRKAELRVVDAAGKVLTKHSLPTDGGLYRVVWNLTSSRRTGGVSGVANRFRQFFGGRGRRGRGRRSFQVGPGRYRIELEVDGKVEVKPLEVR